MGTEEGEPCVGGPEGAELTVLDRLRWLRSGLCLLDFLMWWKEVALAVCEWLCRQLSWGVRLASRTAAFGAILNHF